MSAKYQPARGMRDILPTEARIRDYVQARILETYRRFGYTRVETPALENIELLTGGEGGENAKLVFKVLKRGERLDLSRPGLTEDDLVDLGLRFDLTVPLVRFFVTNRAELPRVFKAIQIGSVWRAERPQKGRFRQFTQCDIDVIGWGSESVEGELLTASAEALCALDFRDFTIRINDRRLLNGIAASCGFPEASHSQVFVVMDKVDKIGVDGVVKELAAEGHAQAAIDKLADLLRSKPAGDPDPKALVPTLPAGVDGAIVDGLQRIVDAVRAEAAGRFRVVFDPNLVRGMGYYTGPVFEVVHAGYGYSIAGGGRYDKMVGHLSGEDQPACGISFGFERVVTILMDRGFKPPAVSKLLALLVSPEASVEATLAEARRLRGDGYAPSIFPRDKKLGRQLETLAAGGFAYHASFDGKSEATVREMSAND